MSERIPLAQLIRARLDNATMEALFQDLTQLCTITDVQMKGSTGAYAGEARPTLEQAYIALTTGTALGVQIRYVWQGEEWWDTLLRKSTSIVLVRTRPPAVDETGDKASPIL